MKKLEACRLGATWRFILTRENIGKMHGRTLLRPIDLHRIRLMHLMIAMTR